MDWRLLFDSVFSARVETFIRTQTFFSSSQMRLFCTFGRKRRRVLLFACETLLPYMTVVPVSWQRLDIGEFLEKQSAKIRNESTKSHE